MSEFGGWAKARRVEVIRLLTERDGPDCFYCDTEIGPWGGKSARSIDRWVPKCHGGTTSVANLRLACAKCNGAKGDLSGDEFMASAWLVKRRASMALLRLREQGQRPDGKGYWHPAVYRPPHINGERVVLGCRICGLTTTDGVDRLADYPCVMVERLESMVR